MIRKDGFYINHKTGTSITGAPFKVTSILIFTKNDLVFLKEKPGIIEPIQFNDDILEMDLGTELSSTLGRYSIINNIIKVIFPLGQISNIDKEYKELIGAFTENKMNLNYNICNWSERVENYYKRTLLENLEFKFYSVIEKKYIEDSSKSPNKDFELKKTDSLKNFSNEINKDAQYDKERNFTIAFVFGLVAGVIGAIFGGFAGFFIGAVIGVIIGFVLKSILD